MRSSGREPEAMAVALPSWVHADSLWNSYCCVPERGAEAVRKEATEVAPTCTGDLDEGRLWAAATERPPG